jgi:hypothetical protein
MSCFILLQFGLHSPFNVGELRFALLDKLRGALDLCRERIDIDLLIAQAREDLLNFGYRLVV